MILVVSALSQEVEEIIQALEHKKTIKLRHLIIQQGKINNVDLLVTYVGIGKVNASFGLSLLLDNYDIDLIVNVGSCGATNDYEIGDVVMVEKAQYHDFDLTSFGYERNQIPNLPLSFLTPIEIINKIKGLNPKFKVATIYSGDSFITKKDLEEHKINASSFICDMECSSLFHVAYFLSVEIISLKIVSDIVQSGENIKKYKEFERNHIGYYCLSALRALLEII
jgi:adenosylhomocysteine nucleosidase